MANVSFINNLLVPAVPNLPIAPVDYNRQFQDQLNNVLRLYFQQLGGAFQAYLNEGGGRFLSVPCGGYFSNQTFDLTANVATVITLNNSDANAVIDTSLSNGSVQVVYPGIYNYQFSAQFDNSDSQDHDVDFWVRVDNVDVYESATRLTIPSRHGSDNGAAVAALNIFITANANSIIDFVVAANHPDIRLVDLPASSSPYVRPSIPSLISTITFVSRLPT
jgi:hypothetical protein